MKRALLILLVSLFGSVTPASAQDVLSARQPLRLAQVLRSVRDAHPSVEEARQMILAAEGDALASTGAFDPKAKLGVKGQPVGKYSKGQLEAVITQVTPWWGAGFYAGWRRGFGSFALYDGDLETLSGGELSAGFNLPLWQGGVIDDMRARMQQAELGVLSAKQQRDFVLLVVENAAMRAYWDWVEAGQQLVIAQELLSVATDRVQGLDRRIEKGDAAPILGTDNRRIVLDRRAKVIAADQKLEQAAVKLSLFMRDAEGAPMHVDATRLPPAFPATSTPARSALARDVRRARQRRPDVALFTLAEEQQEVEVAFRDNEVAPRIDLQGWVAKDFGAGKEELRPLDLGLGVMVEIPLLLRKERGKLDAARAKLAAAKQKTRLARDKVEAEVRMAFAAVEAANELVAVARDKRRAAEALAAAERRKFDLGETDLLTVNLRELSVAEAATAELEAIADFHRALGDYRTATSQSPLGRVGPLR